MNKTLSQHADRILADRRRILTRLVDFYEPLDALAWLRAAQPLLGGARPCDLIKEGRTAEVDRLLDQMEDGVYL